MSKLIQQIHAHSLGIAVEPTPQPKRSLLSATERRAYQAAWRILSETQSNRPDYNDFASRTTRQSRMVDKMAEIIAEEMAAGGTARA